MAQGAQPTRTPEQIVCEISGDCEGNSALDDSLKNAKGAEAGFSFKAPTAAPAASAPAARARAAAPSAVRPAAYSSVAAPKRSFRSIDASITFDNGSSEMTEAGKANAQALATALNSAALSGHRFLIEGHTNSIGTRDANMKLSQDRAESVAAFLKAQGVDATRIDQKGYGFDKPLPNMSAKAAANRRVQVVPLG